MPISTVKELLKQKEKYDEDYYDKGISTVSDEEYDTLVDYLTTLNVLPKSSTDKIPAKPGKAQLPVPMWSLNKCKEIRKPYKNCILMDKLDGVSCLLSKNVAYTRGDGIFGTDVTCVIPQKLFSLFNQEKYAVRGELIVSRETYQKFSDTYSNSRTMVASFVSRLAFSEDIQFIAYELISLDTDDLPPSAQLFLLEEAGFKVVYHEGPFQSVDQEKLTTFLETRREQSEFYIDGIVVAQETKRCARKLTRNPTYAFAFKKNLPGIRTEVTDIVWKSGKSGACTPCVLIKPVVIDGSTIRKVSGHNLNYLTENRIGIGAIIEIIKSGNIIPHISKVVSGTDSIPEPKGVEDSEKEISVAKLLHFGKTLKIAGLGESMARKMVSEFNMDPYSISKCTVDWEKFLQSGGKNHQKLYSSLKSVMQTVTPEEILLAVGFYGVGIGKIKIRKIFKDSPEKGTGFYNEVIAAWNN